MKKNYFLRHFIFVFFSLISFLGFSQSVVINEVVTDPQQDWSANSFNGTPGAGTVSSVDEYLELYIKVGGLDLTGWTIELLDGTDVTGDLTSTGAFDVSNYISSGSGTFLSTEVGDYLVLGNVDGSGAMNNNITINLKNSGGTIIDTVTLGGGTGEAPNGNASSTANEAVIRTLNGNDSDIDSSDFTQSTASMGTTNSSTVNWLGKTDNDWSTSSNWEGNAVPGMSSDVFIANGFSNYPTASSAVTVNTVSISSGASLIAQSTFSGTVTYNRALATTNWYLVSSPVVSQTIVNFYSNESPALGSGSGDSQNVAIAPYDNTQTTGATRWSYYTEGQVDGTGGDDTTDTFGTGTGYSVLLQAAKDVAFTGTMTTENVGISISDGTGSGGNAFNLIGNPYPSYIAANNSADATNNLLKVNDTDNDYLTESTIWLWNQGTSSYDEVNQTGTNYIAPGQGFFVSANGSQTFSITEAMQSHQGTDSFQRNSITRPEITLEITDGTNVRDADIFYINGTTTGFDDGYDSSIFGGVSNNFAIYTHAVANGNGRNLGIQSLPNNDFENMIVPVGINASSGTEITISAASVNLPAGIDVYLEDKDNDTFTLLNSSSAFTTTLTFDLSGIGRFYMHTSSEALSIEEVNLDHISMYMSDERKLRIVGIQNGNSEVHIYNMLGKQVVTSTFEGRGVNDITLPNLRTGIYIVQLETETGKLNRKVIIE